MTHDDIAALRQALAAGPTPGPWHWDSDPVKNDPFDRVRYQVTCIGKTITKVYYSSFEGGPTNAEQDAAYIAAASPDRIARLLDALEAAQQQIEHTERMNAPCKCGAGSMSDCISETCEKVQARAAAKDQA